MAACFCTGACHRTGVCPNDRGMIRNVIVGDFPWVGTAPKDPFKPLDDPQTPAPIQGIGTWQCPGCGTIYTMMINKCECQKRNMVSSSGNTTFHLYPMHTSEMP